MRVSPAASVSGAVSVLPAHVVVNRLSAVLVLLILVVFIRVVSFDFVNIDDNGYVTQNPMVQQGITLESLTWALFSTEHTGFWQPLVWWSLMLDAELFGQWAGGFHLTNVLLHAVNSVILFRWLVRLTGAVERSFFVAAFFAVHPLHVESVAWITERKDVLSTLFGLTALLGWLRFVRTRQRRWYVVSWLSMTLSLMAKQMLVTLPFVFLLLDFWPLGRVGSKADRTPAEGSGSKLRTALLVEKLPFFLLTIFFCVMAWLTQTVSGATRLLDELTLTDRLANAVTAYAIYLRKVFWPLDLCVFYPHPGQDWSGTSVLLSAVALALVSAAVVRQARQRGYLIVGWLWFLGCLVPVIGIVQVGFQQLADRFMYFPLIGIAIAVCWLIPRQGPFSGSARLFTTTCLLACAALSFRQVGTWKDSITLCSHGLEVRQRNWFLEATLGAAIMTRPQDAASLLAADQDYLQLAEQHLRSAIEIQPGFAAAHFNLGLVLSDRGQLTEANNSFRRALQIDPDYYKAQYFLCTNLRRMGDTEELKRQLSILAGMTEGSAVPQ